MSLRTLLLRAARHGYETAGEALDYSIAQTRAALTAKDPQQLAARWRAESNRSPVTVAFPGGTE